MELLFCGVLLGFILATALYINKVWTLQDKIAEKNARIKALKEVLNEEVNKSWEICESKDLFKKW